MAAFARARTHTHTRALSHDPFDCSTVCLAEFGHPFDSHGNGKPKCCWDLPMNRSSQRFVPLFLFFLRVLSLTLSCTRSLILSSLIFSFFSISWRRIHFVSIFDNAHIHRTIYLMCKSVLMMLRSFGGVLSKFSSERVRFHLFHMRGYRFPRIRALHSECNRAYVLCTYNWSIELVSVYSWASFSSYLSPPPGLFSLWIILWTVNTHTERDRAE